LRAELTANPRKRDTAVRLAERYFALATSEGDPRYVGYAQAALKPWWDLPAPPLDVLVMRAILKQYSHDFSGRDARPRSGDARGSEKRAPVVVARRDPPWCKRITKRHGKIVWPCRSSNPSSTPSAA